MKLITTAIDLEKEFKRLMKNYNEFYWATAWAGASSALFNELTSKKDKIKEIAVGIHFYQTHPDFISEFLDNNSVRFILQPEGTYHPKVYLFYTDQLHWELIIGSANFTKEAFTRNTEASILISNTDSNSSEILESVLQLVNDLWKNGKVFSEDDLKNYRISWLKHRPKINSLSGNYGSQNKKSKPIFEVPIMNKSWRDFMIGIRSEESNGLMMRLKVIEISNDLFNKVDHFKELSKDERRFIAGVSNKLAVEGSEYWAYFGSMRGNGEFQSRINENDIDISRALDQIPLFGQITKKHFDNFKKYFSRSISGNPIGTATRLLSMKRPDIFVCLDSKNRSALCKDFGITQSGMDLDRYWNDIVERIFDCEWWQNPTPKNAKEIKVSDARGAFLDSLYYVR